MERGKRMEYVNSTAGAVPIKNKKGETTMKKVRVNRYISGRKPDFADEKSDSSSEEEIKPVTKSAPNFISSYGTGLLPIKDEFEKLKIEVKEEAEEDEEFHERRRQIRQKLLEKQEERPPSESESEYEFVTDSEEEEIFEEDVKPLPKPVFVGKAQRLTLNEQKEREERERLLEIEREKVAEERRQQTLRIIEEENKTGSTNRSTVAGINDINSEDEDDEVAYECWKIRELKRLKADREEMEREMAEKAEVERMHALTDEMRAEEMKKKGGRIITNKKIEGNMKFLQKYYHRGVFYLDQEDNVLKRDFNQPTLDDHFDKTILPSVKQVKRFGEAGRTKYTHLVDQDTTVFVDSPWGDEAKGGVRSVGGIGGIKSKEVFTRPGAKKIRRV